MSKTLFEKIAAREIPATIVYEDDLVFALRDINPQAPKHVLVVPKKPIPRLAEARPEDHQLLGHLLLKAAEVAAKLGLNESGYRLVINNGEDGGERSAPAPPPPGRAPHGLAAGMIQSFAINFRNTRPSRRMPSRMSSSLALPKLMRISWSGFRRVASSA